MIQTGGNGFINLLNVDTVDYRLFECLIMIHINIILYYPEFCIYLSFPLWINLLSANIRNFCNYNFF